MTSVEIRVVIILLAVVLVCGAVIWVISTVLRSRRMVEFNKGPGNPDEPAPTQPWRRFTGALSAPHSRPEWVRVNEARRLHSADQVYFGFASALSPFTVVNALRTDWGVKNAAQARQRLATAQRTITEHAAAVMAQRDLPGGREVFRDKLLAAGAPSGALNSFLAAVEAVHADQNPEIMVDVDGLAFDIARVANLARWSGYVRYVEPEQGTEVLDHVGIAAAAVFTNWDDFADAYSRGMATRYKGGTKHYTRAVEWLRTDVNSPWTRQRWLPEVKSVN